MSFPSICIIAGPASSGKGALVEEMYLTTPPGIHVVGIGMGSILDRRRRIDDEIGRDLALKMARRELVTDETVCELMLNEFHSRVNPETDLVILDGFPRNLLQLKYLYDEINASSVTVVQVVSPLDRCLKLMSRRCRHDDGEDQIRFAYKRYNDHEMPVVDEIVYYRGGTSVVVNCNDRPDDWHIKNEAGRVWIHIQSVFGWKTSRSVLVPS